VNFEDFQRRAAVVRDVPLEAVLIYRGAVRDRRDKSKWRTERGPVTVTGAKFTSWRDGRGGGGAIDLVMCLSDVDVRAAVTWLEQQCPFGERAFSFFFEGGPSTAEHQPCRGVMGNRSLASVHGAWPNAGWRSVPA